MKKRIRALVSDLSKKRNDYIPSIPPASAKAPEIDLDSRPPDTVPDDLNNQELSTDQAERVRQLDYQAQRQKEKGTLPG